MKGLWAACGAFGLAFAGWGQCTPGYESAGFPGALRGSGMFAGNYTTGEVSCAVRWDPDGAGPLPEWLVVGGAFSTIDNIPAVNVAGWDGQAWHAIGAGVGSVSSQEAVYSLAVHNGSLYAGGRFARSGSLTATLNGVARFDGTNWVAVGTGVPANNSNTIVHAVASFNGDLYAGGGFGNFNQMNVARWNGTQWLAVAGGLGTSTSSGSARAPVMSLVVHMGSLYAGGAFQTSNVPPYGVVSVARLNQATGWEMVGAGLGGSGTTTVVQSLVSDGADLLAVGKIPALAPSVEGQIARWDGAAWTPMLTTPNTVPLNSAGRLGADLLVGSDAMRLQRVSGNGLEYVGPQLYEAGTAVGSDQRKTIVLGPVAGGVLIGGNFRRSDTADVDWRFFNSLAVWDGAAYSPLSLAPDKTIGAFARYNGELYAVGSFLYVNNQRCNRVARAGGATWVPLGDGTGLNGRAHCAVEWNGRLVVGGLFTQAGGQAASRVAAWNGAAWEAMGAGVPESGVRRLINYNGQLLAVCGDFTYITDFFTPVLRRWDGAAWVVFGNPDGSDANFMNPVVHNNELYAARSVSEGTVRWSGTAWVAVSDPAQPVTPLGVWQGSLLGVGAGSTCRLGAGGWEVISAQVPSVQNALAGFEHEGFFFLGGMNGSVPQLVSWNGTSWLFHSAVANAVPTVANCNISAFAEQNGRLLVGGGMGGISFVTPTLSYRPSQSLAYVDMPDVAVFLAVPQARLIGPGQSTTLAVSVMNPAGVTYQWRRDGVDLLDGVQADGSTVLGAQGASMEVGNAAEPGGAYSVRVTRAGCSSVTASVAVTVGCDSIDFNQDSLFPDAQDIADFLTVFGGGACPTGLCNDIDFNNDTLFPDVEDIAVLLRVFSGGPCGS